MGYKSPIHLLELKDFQDGDEGLVVKVVPPNVRESADMNAGRRRNADDSFAETSEDYSRRAFSYLAPKIRFWNLEDEDGRPIALPRDARETPEGMVDYLYELDENIVLAIYHEWRLVGMPKPKDSDEGKESGAPSENGPGESSNNGMRIPDLRELESQIPMG